MQLTIGTQLHGFTVQRIRPISETRGTLVQMVYDKTGTELVWHKSEEQNKLFCVGFKTLPEDSTGVFHILEHSVLCGSAKYPVKEPFVELLKSSMNTFLNAMTFPDKTIYPVSSRNRQDFLNLTSVYLDAVFAPRILTEPNIFYQEGWHYEPDGDKLKYKGVVFNEMKGAMSSVDQVVASSIEAALFPDNCYGFNSGGDPRVIPDLTYQQFIDTYRKNYHPTNARVYLDGDVPVDEVLEMIDAYFSQYEMGQKQHIQLQSIKSQETTVYYEATGEDLSGKAHLALGKIFCNFDDKVKILAAQVLSDILIGSNAAPLKKALLTSGLAQNVTFRITDGVAQPWYTLHLHNMEDARSSEALELIRSTVNQMLEAGLNQDELVASINRLAFRIKQAQEPQGLIRCISALDSWLYEGDPALYLSYDDAIAQLRVMTENGGFDAILRQLLLDETGRCIVHVLPSATYGEETRAREEARLQQYADSLDAAARKQLEEQNEALTNWQKTADTLEQLATLPVLDLNEIRPEPEFIKTTQETVGGVTVLRHQVPSNGIVYISMYFNLSDCSQEELAKLSLLSNLLGKLPTARHDALALQNAIKRDIGSLSFGVDVFAKLDQTQECTPCLYARCSVLKENLAAAEALIHEILTETDFEQPDLIRQTLMQAEMESQQMGIMAGHILAVTSTAAQFSAQGAVNDYLKGYSRISWIHNFVKEFDQQIGSYSALLRNKLENAVCTNRLVMASVAEDGHSCIDSLLARFPAGTACPAAAAFQTTLPAKMGIRIPAQVSFAIESYHLANANMAYNGQLRLLTKIVSLSYLWNEVRVQGGAYGAGMQAGRSGSMMCYSYRDPSPARTLGVYGTISQFVREFCNSEEPLDKFIISTIASTEPLISPDQEARAADDRWFSGADFAGALQERQEILAATKEALLNWCDLADQFAQKGAVCVVGYADALEACGQDALTILDL